MHSVLLVCCVIARDGRHCCDGECDCRVRDTAQVRSYAAVFVSLEPRLLTVCPCKESVPLKNVRSCVRGVLQKGSRRLGPSTDSNKDEWITGNAWMFSAA